MHDYLQGCWAGTAASSNLGRSETVAGLSCPSPCSGALHLRRGPVQERVPGGAAKAATAPSPCSSHRSSRGAQAAVGSCGSSSPFSPCSPGAAAASPGTQPPREATPCWAVVSAGQGQAAAPGEVRHSVCCLIISCPRARSRAHTNSAGLR